MTVGELFAGIGGLGLGLERAGMEVKWAIENEPYAAAVYCKNFPDVQVVEQDIGEVDFGELEWVDLLTGGFPCQDISYAGKGAGIEGERSGLWSEFWRAIRIVRPRLVLVENVPALLGRGLDRVLGDLATLGYDAEWDCIPAAAFGAEHLRDRLFLVANAVRQGLPVGSNTRANGTHARVFGTWPGPSITYEAPGLERRGASRWRGNVHGIPFRVDRVKCLGQAVVPQVAEWIGRRILEVYGDRVVTTQDHPTGPEGEQ